MIKRFDPELYRENDERAKAALRKVLGDSVTYTIQDNPKKRGVDLLVFNGDKHIFNIEVEVKKVWASGVTFPYNTVQFPERKEKYAKLEVPTLFVMFNKDQTKYLAVTDRDLIESPKVMVSNKYVRTGENFFQVPKDKVFFDNIQAAISRLTKFGKILYK